MRRPKLQIVFKVQETCINPVSSVLFFTPFLTVCSIWFIFLIAAEHWDSAFLELFILTLKTLSLLSGNGQVKVHNLIYEAKIVFHYSISQDVLLLCHETILLLCHEAS